MKVLHIMSGFGGGISSFIKNKATALKDTDITFDVLTYDEVNESFQKAIEALNGDIYYMDNPKEKGYRLFYKQVDKIFKNQPKDLIIHCHIQGYRMLPFYMIAKKHKVKRFIVHAHTDLEKKDRDKPINQLNRWVNTTLPIEKVSCGVKASINIFGEKPVNNKEIMHIPNSIDPESFFQKIDIQQKKQQLVGNNNTHKMIIGNVARFHKQKNHDFMIKLIETLSKTELEFIWLFVGEGVLLESSKELVEEKNLTDYVRFLGRRNDLAELYKIMDIFVLPSLYEGLPTVAIEAQAAGTTTFLSDSITKESDLELNIVSFLPKSDVATWENAILEHKTNEISLAEREKQLHEKKFTNQLSAELYCSFLNKEINSYDI